MAYFFCKTLAHVHQAYPFGSVISGDAAITDLQTDHIWSQRLSFLTGTPTVTLLYTVPKPYIASIVPFGSYLTNVQVCYTLTSAVTGTLTLSVVRLGLNADGDAFTASASGSNSSLPVTAGTHKKSVTITAKSWQYVYQVHFIASVAAVDFVDLNAIKLSYQLRV